MAIALRTQAVPGWRCTAWGLGLRGVSTKNDPNRRAPGRSDIIIRETWPHARGSGKTPRDWHWRVRSHGRRRARSGSHSCSTGWPWRSWIDGRAEEGEGLLPAGTDERGVDRDVALRWRLVQAASSARKMAPDAGGTFGRWLRRASWLKVPRHWTRLRGGWSGGAWRWRAASRSGEAVWSDGTRAWWTATD